MVLPVSHRISPVPRYSGYCSCNKSISPTGLSPYIVTLSSAIQLYIYSQLLQSYNPDNAVTSSVWAIPSSLTTTSGITFVFFSCGYLDVSVHRVCLLFRILYLQYSGFPHSDISGSKVICTSPKLFAAYHVLHRLWEPRHPPCALINFLNYLIILLYSILLLYSSTWRNFLMNRYYTCSVSSVLSFSSSNMSKNFTVSTLLQAFQHTW